MRVIRGAFYSLAGFESAVRARERDEESG